MENIVRIQRPDGTIAEIATDPNDATLGQGLNELSRTHHLVNGVWIPDIERHVVKVTFANGDTLTTPINGTPDEIRAYYLREDCWFNLGTGDKDNLQRAIDVKFLD